MDSCYWFTLYTAWPLSSLLRSTGLLVFRDSAPDVKPDRIARMAMAAGNGILDSFDC